MIVHSNLPITANQPTHPALQPIMNAHLASHIPRNLPHPASHWQNFAHHPTLHLAPYTCHPSSPLPLFFLYLPLNLSTLPKVSHSFYTYPFIFSMHYLKKSPFFLYNPPFFVLHPIPCTTCLSAVKKEVGINISLDQPGMF